MHCVNIMTILVYENENNFKIQPLIAIIISAYKLPITHNRIS